MCPPSIVTYCKQSYQHATSFRIFYDWESPLFRKKDVPNSIRWKLGLNNYCWSCSIYTTTISILLFLNLKLPKILKMRCISFSCHVVICLIIWSGSSFHHRHVKYELKIKYESLEARLSLCLIKHEYNLFSIIDVHGSL